jgi:serine/threonine protein kinase
MPCENMSPSLVSLLQGMLTKNPEQRLTMQQIRQDGWVTMEGMFPMLSHQENCGVFEVTEEDVKDAVRPAMSLMSKVRIHLIVPFDNNTLCYIDVQKTSLEALQELFYVT